MRVLALIDGEHRPEVVRDALDRLAREHEVCGAVFVGGEEKVSPAVLADARRHYGRPVAVAGADPQRALRELVAEHGAEAVADLSGEPVLGGDKRFGLASLALHLGLEYRAPGMELRPPPAETLEFDGPVLAVIGTGKRTGKTAVASHYASLLRGLELEPVVVAMGRGGPPEPVLVRGTDAPSLPELLDIARAGRHAASDYLEDAVLAGITSIGCRRCGEGPAGEPFDSNVVAGARLGVDLQPDVILLEGSGAALPPIVADRTVCVTLAERARIDALSHLGPYRLLRSDLLLVNGADHLAAAELAALKSDLARWSGPAPVIGCRLEPEPGEPLPPGARAALFTTAAAERRPEISGAIERHGVEVAFFSPNLARRAALERDVDRAAAAGCEVFLTELKALAVEVVAERASREGIHVALVRNRPVALPGEPDLDTELRRLVPTDWVRRRPLPGRTTSEVS
jgi:cyclic 2,3-diphosphoglycerate synthetase